MLALSVPATVGLIVLAPAIVALIFEHGQFTATDTIATAGALQFYAVGLVGYSIVRIVSPAFYALRRSRIPVAASIASVVANVLLAVTLVRVMSFAGLALATSLAAIVNAGIQLILLRRELGGIEAGRITLTLGKTTVAALAMGAAAWYTELSLRTAWPGTAIGLQALRVFVAIGVALAVLSACAWLLRLHEFEEARGMVSRRFRRASR
jgi:putative peptidoglycan lipid II flippase